MTEGATLAALNDDPQTDLLALANPAGNAYELVALNGADGSLLWRAPLPNANSQAAIAHDSELIFVGAETTISAFGNADGSSRWQARLPDKLNTHPSAGLHVVGDTVVGYSYDNTLTAFDRRSGAQRWQKILPEKHASGSVALGDLVCVGGRDEADERDQLHCYAAESGERVSAIDLGHWAAKHDYWPAADGAALYRFNFEDEQSVLTKFQPSDGAALWEQPLPAAFNEAFFDDDVALLEDGPRLALSISDQITVISGTASVDVVLADHKLHPLGFSGDLLFAGAIKQRGTTTLSILAIDARTGEVRWKDDRFGETHDDFGDGRPWAVVPGGLAYAWEQRDAQGQSTLRTAVFGPSGLAWERTDAVFSIYDRRILATKELMFVSPGGAIIAYEHQTGVSRWETGR